MFFFNLFNVIFFIKVAYGYVATIAYSFNVVFNDVPVLLTLKVFYDFNVAAI